jgi:Flp pilus assembly protein TadB
MDPDHVEPQSNVPQSAPILDYHPGGQRAQTVPLRRFSSEFEANLAVSALRSGGIRAQLVGQTVQNMLSIYGTATNGVDLLVTAEDADNARGILEKIDQRRARRTARTATHCPRCQSTLTRNYDPRRALAGWGLFVIAAVIAVIPGGVVWALILFIAAVTVLILSMNRRTCRHCGDAWTPRPDDD